jgi:hypothetical protein
MNTIPFIIAYQGMLLKGYANPTETFEDIIPSSMLIFIQGWCIGTLTYNNENWSMDQPIDSEFVIDLANQIQSQVRSIKAAMRYK